MMDYGREIVKNSNHHRRSSSIGRESKAHSSEREPETSTPSSDFVLQWGNRKRLRCMKLQAKNDSKPDLSRGRLNRAVVNPIKDITPTINCNNNTSFRRPVSPPPPQQRISRNSESMKGGGQSNNNGVGGANISSPDRAAEEKKINNNNNNVVGVNNGVVGGASGSSETAHDSKKGGSSSNSDAVPVWLPKFVIALTNKEKEEDFMAIKGSKLPQRPKKRAKFIQRTLNLVSPGAWLCDLTLERYEVREKKISKKRPRGLKAMGNMDSDSD